MVRRYHVSSKDHGPRFIFTPQISNKASAKECQETPRVCVAPTIKQCLLSIEGVDSLLPYNNLTYVKKYKSLLVVYIIEARAYKPFGLGVPDLHITDERWILKPVEGIRLGFICPYTLAIKSVIKIVSRKQLTNIHLKWSKRK